MTERKSLSKKTRFEVFKRDSFTCQYCGSKAPNVILEVDHINPVSNGGENDLLNLVTSCFLCNRGKSDRKISDNSIVEKQRAQIEELNLRRQQLEMLLKFRDGLQKNSNFEVKKAVKYYNSLFDSISLNDYGEKSLGKLVEKFGLINVLDAIDIAKGKYFYGQNESEISGKMFEKLGGILHLKDKPEHIQKISYIKGICKNKFSSFNERKYMIIINQCYELNIDLEQLKQMLLNDDFKNSTQLFESLERYITLNS